LKKFGERMPALIVAESSRISNRILREPGRSHPNLVSVKEVKGPISWLR